MVCICLCSLLAFLAVCFCCVWALPHLHPVPGLLSASTAQPYIQYFIDIVSSLNVIFLICIQTVHDGRQFMKYIDPKLGVPLPERDYGGNCLIYDPGHPTDPLHNIWVCITTNIIKTISTQIIKISYRGSGMSLVTYRVLNIHLILEIMFNHLYITE